MKFFKCEHCGKIITTVNESQCDTVCCGEVMNEIKAGTVDAAREKHIPVYEVSEGKVSVTVGSVEHPMLEAHYIEWIALETHSGVQIKYLCPGSEPKAVFAVCEGDEIMAVYAYCNLHSLWKAN